MSKNKRGSGADQFYSTHFGSAYNTLPANQREARIRNMYINIGTELATNRFKWENLPESWDERFLEMCLFYHALAIVYYDNDYEKLLAVRGAGMGYVNMLDNPTSFTVVGPGYDSLNQTFLNKTISAYDPTRHSYLDDEVKRTKAIPIWANYTRMPQYDIIAIYAQRLAELDRTIEINSKNARRNKIIKVPPNMQLSAVNAVRQIDEGVEVLQLTGPMADSQFVEAIDLGIEPKTIEQLHILRTRQWNEFMGLIGIDNANQDKKERLVADEVSANDAQTDSMRFVALNARRQACAIINEVFNENITVDFNTEIEARANELFQMTGGDGNGNIHSSTEESD